MHDDLIRYLNRKPVEARVGARFYRFSRFIARHRAAVAMTLLTLVSLCVSLVFAIEQSHLAARQDNTESRLCS